MQLQDEDGTYNRRNFKIRMSKEYGQSKDMQLPEEDGYRTGYFQHICSCNKMTLVQAGY